MEANNIEIENIIDEENDIKSKKKVYNLTYYNKHRSSILEKLKEKKTCIYCDRIVQ